MSISKVVCGESAGTKGNFFLIHNFLNWSESQSCFAVRYEQGMNHLLTFLLSGWQMVFLQSISYVFWKPYDRRLKKHGFKITA